ncbi:MAG: ABC transporter permease [Gammaproteobacteria bacterium]
MNSIQTIPLANLALAILPALFVIGILFKWRLNAFNAIYALIRMFAQLLMIGFFLTTLFTSQSAGLIVSILALMVIIASWIALGSIIKHRRQLYGKAVLAMTLGSGSTLFITTFGVIELQPWYEPRYLIPLGGMIFANAMNSLSLAAERLESEISRNRRYDHARTIAFNAALIPIINSLFAVGLVALPGMMTGQILSGISPFIAARYQIMVMCMLFASSGLTTACFLVLIKKDFINGLSDKLQS